MKRIAIIVSLLGFICTTWAAKINSEKTITVDGKTRKYVLYVPDNVGTNPALVFSLHGASGHDTDRSPFRTAVADSKGCIVVYPQGENQYFPVFGGSIPGWNSTGEANEDLEFFKAIIEELVQNYAIDRQRIYCCGFSNGGMMTYANSTAAADIFAAFASISGFQLNEFHHRPTGKRPVPFLHIHGKADDFVKYSCMPIIRDNMVARNGCNPVPVVKSVSGKYTLSIYEAGKGGFPYVYYEIDGMGHSDYTANTEEGNSALTMWNFMSQYSLDDVCDSTLKWRLNIDTEGWNPKEHSWRVNAARTKFEYGTSKKANIQNNNVYPSLQFEKGDYVLTIESTGIASNKIYVQVETLDGNSILFSKSGKVGERVVMPFFVPDYTEYKITIVKESADDRFSSFAFHSTNGPSEAENSEDDTLPEVAPDTEAGYLIEIPQNQGKQYDNFTRTAFNKGEEYNTYTATGDLQIAFKMMNIDITDCDYVLVKFAEPVQSGWKIAFWEGTSTVEIPAGSEEYRFEFEPQMFNTGVLPQICMMTLFGGYQSPLIAKVLGVYKHCTKDSPNAVAPVTLSNVVPVGYYSLEGKRLVTPIRGVNIVLTDDGKSQKFIFR